MSVPSLAAAAVCGGFAAEHRVGTRYRSTAAGARQQRRRSTALSSKCGQSHVDSRVGEAERKLVGRISRGSLFVEQVQLVSRAFALNAFRNLAPSK